MRVFVYEYTCSGGAAGSESLRAEGLAMLSAVMQDLGRVSGVEALTLLDERCPRELTERLPGRIHSGADAAAFRRLVRWADYTLVIAPEFDGLLRARCSWVLEEGGRLLGPSPEAVRLTGDKWRLGQHLRDRGIPTPPVCRRHQLPRPQGYPLVLKPRHGAGSLATFLVADPQQLEACIARAEVEGGAEELLLQEFVTGQAASVALLIGPGGRIPLLPAAQHLSEEGRLRYLGGSVPLQPALAERAVRLALGAAESVAGLCGYVGVDLVLGGAGDGSQDWVIEINPRLTTSYVGLRALAQTNLAGAMLRVVQGEMLAELGWRAGSVRFRADGQVIS